MFALLGLSAFFAVLIGYAVVTRGCTERRMRRRDASAHRLYLRTRRSEHVSAWLFGHRRQRRLTHRPSIGAVQDAGHFGDGLDEQR